MNAETYNTRYLLKPECDAVRKKYRDFWQHQQSDCPLLSIKAKKTGTLPNRVVDSNKSRKERDLDLHWHINDCLNQVTAYDFLFDSMPVAGVMFGRDITNMGVLAGYEFDIHPQTEFIAFEKNKQFLFEPTPKFGEEMPYVQNVLAIYRGVREEVQQLACLNPPTTADALTTMAMIMGTDNFLLSLFKHPAAVNQKARELNHLFYSFYDFIYQYLLECGYGESASWFPVFAEGKFDSVRSDISVMLSEKMFVSFALPAIEDACSYMDYAMFNLDSVKLFRFLEHLATIKALDGIYWNIEPWLYDLAKYLPVLKRIRELGFILALPCQTVSDAMLAINHLGKSGLLLELPVYEDQDQAIAAGEAIVDFANHCLY